MIPDPYWQILDATQQPVLGTLAPSKSLAIDAYGRRKWGEDRKQLELTIVRTAPPENPVHASIEALIGG